MGRLVSEGALVEAIAQQAEAKDGGSEGIARRLGISAKGFGEEAGAVLCSEVRGGGSSRSEELPIATNLGGRQC